MLRILIQYLYLVSFLLVLNACDDDGKPIITYVGGEPMTAGEGGGDDCPSACDTLLSCEELASCGVDALQTAREHCLELCETSAESIIADAAIECSLTADRVKATLRGLSRCIEGTEDLCEGQICGPGFSCDSMTGLCVDSCADVVCAAGVACEDGACQDPCLNVTCPVGLGCFLGDCIDLCFGNSCTENQYCEPSTGECLDLCGEVMCRSGQRCEAGVCVLACNDVECPDGQSCDPNTGACIDLCADVNCRAGFVCNPLSGMCLDACDLVSCAEGWSCQAGDCFLDDPCADTVCEGDFICNPNNARCERFFCSADRLEGASSNNEVSNATRLPSQTQRLDNLTICSFDIDWYDLLVPAGVDARVSLRFEHNVGDLIIRLYSNTNLLTPLMEVNSQTDDEFLAILESDVDRRFFIRVSSGGGMFDQNRYSLVLEMNLPHPICNEDQDCIEQGFCQDSLCGGGIAINPEVDPLGAVEPMDPVDPMDPPCQADVYEPNNQSNQATSLTEDGSWSGTLCAGDQDWYQITVTETSTVEISLEFVHAEGNIDATLVDENGSSVALGVSLTDREYLLIEDLQAGVYSLLVRGASSDVENTYSLSVTRTPNTEVMNECMIDEECRGDYVCISGACRIPQGYCEDEASPNASYMDAYHVSVPSTINELTLCDADFFAISLQEGDSVTLTVTFSNLSGEDIDMKLYQPNGMVVRVGMGVTSTEQIEYIAETSGVHTLEVYPYIGFTNPQPFITRYTLKVE